MKSWIPILELGIFSTPHPQKEGKELSELIDSEALEAIYQNFCSKNSPLPLYEGSTLVSWLRQLRLGTSCLYGAFDPPLPPNLRVTATLDFKTANVLESEEELVLSVRPQQLLSLSLLKQEEEEPEEKQERRREKQERGQEEERPQAKREANEEPRQEKRPQAKQDHEEPRQEEHPQAKRQEKQEPRQEEHPQGKRQGKQEPRQEKHPQGKRQGKQERGQEEERPQANEEPRQEEEPQAKRQEKQERGQEEKRPQAKRQGKQEPRQEEERPQANEEPRQEEEHPQGKRQGKQEPRQQEKHPQGKRQEKQERGQEEEHPQGKRQEKQERGQEEERPQAKREEKRPQGKQGHEEPRQEEERPQGKRLAKLKAENTELLHRLVDQDLKLLGSALKRDKVPVLREALFQRREATLAIIGALRLPVRQALHAREALADTPCFLSDEGRALQQEAYLKQLKQAHPHFSQQQIWQLAKSRQAHLFQPNTPTINS